MFESVVQSSSLNNSFETMPGHWLLASLGKRVLRPGGLELSQWMIKELAVSQDDDIVEFAPGLGRTAEIILKNNPRSYTGVEKSEDAAAEASKAVHGPNRSIRVADAAATGLADGHATKACGEAFLTMQSSRVKAQILKEVARILKPGGVYGMHELSLMTDAPERTSRTQKDLTESIRVNARPISAHEWSKLLDGAGFDIVKTKVVPMTLLEPKRLLQDEGIIGLARICINLLRHPAARSRVLEMRRSFRRHGDVLQAIGIIARKR